MRNRYVHIATFYHQVEAHLVRTWLESYGLRCHVFNEKTISIRPFHAIAFGGIQLVCESEDAEEALKLYSEQPYTYRELEKGSTKHMFYSGMTALYFYSLLSGTLKAVMGGY